MTMTMILTDLAKPLVWLSRRRQRGRSRRKLISFSFSRSVGMREEDQTGALALFSFPAGGGSD